MEDQLSLRRKKKKKLKFSYKYINIFSFKKEGILPINKEDAFIYLPDIDILYIKNNSNIYISTNI